MPPRAPALPPEQRRAALIQATLPLLREKGLAVSTREIAQAAGVAEGTIFRVFDNKDELIHACLHHAFDNTALLAELDRVDHALPLPDRLVAAVTIMQGHLQEIFALMSVLRSGGQPLRPPGGADVAAQREQATAELDKAFTALIGEDSKRLRVPVKSFIGYLRMLTLSSVHPMLGGHPATPLELVDVILEGALRRPAHARTSRGK